MTPSIGAIFCRSTETTLASFLTLLRYILLEALGCQFLDYQLGPTARRSTDIDDSLDAVEDIVHLVNVHQLVGTSRSESVLLGLAVVDVLTVSLFRGLPFSNKC